MSPLVGAPDSSPVSIAAIIAGGSGAKSLAVALLRVFLAMAAWGVRVAVTAPRASGHGGA
jgi:hypothetical protein